MLPANVDLCQEEKETFSGLGCLIAANICSRFVGAKHHTLPLLSAMEGAATRRGVEKSRLFTSVADAQVGVDSPDSRDKAKICIVTEIHEIPMKCS